MNISKRCKAILNMLLVMSVPITGFAKSDADIVVYNANIYTVDDSKPWASAMAIKNGTIIEIGNDSILNHYSGSDVA